MTQPVRIKDKLRMEISRKVELGKSSRFEDKKKSDVRFSPYYPEKDSRLARGNIEQQKKPGIEIKSTKHPSRQDLPAGKTFGESTPEFSPVITNVISLACNPPVKTTPTQREKHTSIKEMTRKTFHQNGGSQKQRTSMKHPSRFKPYAKKTSAELNSEISPIIRKVSSLACNSHAKTSPSEEVKNSLIKVVTPADVLKTLRKLKSLMAIKISSCSSASLSTHSLGGLKNENLIQVMVHFREDSSVYSVSIGVIDTEDKTSVTQCFADICKKWKIPAEKVTAVVSIMNPPIIEAIKAIFGKDKLLYCFAEQVNRVASKIFRDKEVTDTCSKAKDILFLLKDEHGMFSEMADDTGEEIEPQEHWYFNLRILEKCLAVFVGRPGILSTSELNVMGDIYSLLKFLNSIRMKLKLKRIFYTSEVIPMVRQLKKDISEFIPLSPDGKLLRDKLDNLVREKFQNIEYVHLFGIPTLLDPRFKGTCFEKSQSSLEAIWHITNILEDRMIRTSTNFQSMKNPRERKSKDMHDVRFTGSPQFVRTISQELGSFIDCPILPYEGTDPVKFWIDNSFQFPNVWKVSVAYICVPATSFSVNKMDLGEDMKFRGKKYKAKLESRLFMHSIPKSVWKSFD